MEHIEYQTGPLILLALALVGILVADLAWAYLKRRCRDEQDRRDRNRHFDNNRKDRP